VHSRNVTGQAHRTQYFEQLSPYITSIRALVQFGPASRKIHDGNVKQGPKPSPEHGPRSRTKIEGEETTGLVKGTFGLRCIDCCRVGRPGGARLNRTIPTKPIRLRRLDFRRGSGQHGPTSRNYPLTDKAQPEIWLGAISP